MSSIFKLTVKSVIGLQICLPEEGQPQFPNSERKKVSLCFHFPAENMILSMLNAVSPYTHACLSQLRTRNFRHWESKETMGLGKQQAAGEVYCLLVHFESIIARQHFRNVYIQKHKNKQLDTMFWWHQPPPWVKLEQWFESLWSRGCFWPSLR